MIMHIPQHYHCEFQSIAVSTWAENSFRTATEFPVDYAIELYGRDSNICRSDHYIDHASMQKRTVRGAAGDFHHAVLTIFEPMVDDQVAKRLALFWMLIWDRFYHSWTIPRPKDLVDERDIMAPEFQYAYDQIFGPKSTFQKSAFSYGPIGAFFHSHALRMKVAKTDGLPLGPFSAFRGDRWFAIERRSLLGWFKCEHLPGPGWFRDRAEVPIKSPSSPPCEPWVQSTKTINGEEISYTVAYPWREWISFGDMIVYHWARACSIVIRELVEADISHEEAVRAMLKVIAIDPIGSGMTKNWVVRGEVQTVNIQDDGTVLWYPGSADFIEVVILISCAIQAARWGSGLDWQLWELAMGAEPGDVDVV